MPTVVNGIGTWYYGKRNLTTRHGVCDSCAKAGHLASYDTTLYIVVVFIPVIPLGTKRIIDSCPSCKQHRIMSLKEWERTKAESIGDGALALADDPDNPDLACKALAAAVSFTAKDEFLGLASSLSPAVTNNADVQSVLHVGMERFGMIAPARAAAEAAVQLDPSSHPRKHDLAIHLLQHHNVDEAAPLARAVINASPADAPGILFLLVEALQAEGRHAEARQELESAAARSLVDASSKDYKRYYKLSTKHESSGKKITSALIRPDAPKNASGKGSFWAPRLIAASIAALVIIVYFATAFSRGSSREVWLISGLSQDTRYLIDGGKPVVLRALTPVRIKLAEGSHTITPVDPASPLGEQSFAMETNFFARPFTNATFVVNPDQLVVLLKEVHTYSNTPNTAPSPADEYLAPALLHDLRGIDFPFTPPPQQLKLKRNESKTRTSLVALQDVSPLDIASITASQHGEQAAEDLVRRAITLEPQSEFWFIALDAILEPEAALQTLKPLLAKRPPLVEAHRSYQNHSKGPVLQSALLAEYAKLHQETRTSTTAYLLGRVTHEWPAAAALYEQACRPDAPGKPLALAARALAHHGVLTGDNQAALTWSVRAREINPDMNGINELSVAALQGLGRYDEALASLMFSGDPQADALDTALARVTLLVQAGKADQAREHINTFTSSRLGSDEGLAFARSRLQSTMHYAAGTIPEFVAAVGREGTSPDDDFMIAIATGEASAAASAVSTLVGTSAPATAVSAGIAHLTVYLAAKVAGNVALATEQYAKALSEFRLAGPDAADFLPMLEGTAAPSADRFANANLHRANIALLSAALAFEYPDSRSVTLPLAKKLNVDPGFPRLTVKAAIDVLERK